MRKFIIIGTLVVSTQLSPGIHNITWITAKELKCLADNVYYEARGEPFEGQKMVARVVINRTLDEHYPSDVCAVVYQPYQFSWTLKKQKLPNIEQYEIAKLAVLEGLHHPTEAIFYHAERVRPGWAKAKEFLEQQGKHRFYK